MEKIIGFKFTFEEDNGDYCEWHETTRFESPLYTTREAVEESIKLVKQRLLDAAKADMKHHFEMQSECEYSQCRDINKFMCECCKALYNQQKRILHRMSSVKIVAVCAETEPSSEYIIEHLK